MNRIVLKLLAYTGLEVVWINKTTEIAEFYIPIGWHILTECVRGRSYVGLSSLGMQHLVAEQRRIYGASNPAQNLR